jgi:hypothetical protein
MTHSKIKDVRPDGTVFLEDGYHFAAEIDSEGPHVSFASVRVYISPGHVIGHETLTEDIKISPPGPHADSDGEEGGTSSTVAMPGVPVDGPGSRPDEGNHPSVQAPL